MDDPFLGGAVDRKAVLRAAKSLGGPRKAELKALAPSLPATAEELGLDLELFAAEWLAFRHVWRELVEREHLDTVERVGARDPRAILAVTLAGSVLSGDPPKTGTRKRRVRYTPLGSHEGAPMTDEYTDAVLPTLQTGKGASISHPGGADFTSALDVMVALKKDVGRLHDALVASVCAIQGRKAVAKRPAPAVAKPESSDDFQRRHGKGRPAPTAMIAAYRGKVPDQLLAFWRHVGPGSFDGGLFFITDPRDFKKAFAPWSEETTKNAPVIARTAFGDLIFWNAYAERVCFLDTRTGRVDFLTPDPASFFSSYFSSPRIRPRLPGGSSFYDDVLRSKMRRAPTCSVDLASGRRMLVVSTNGDGTFPNYWGLSASGELVCLVTDFYVLLGPRLTGNQRPPESFS
jgi:hypothetical protein